MRFFTGKHVAKSLLETVSMTAVCFLLLIICAHNSHAGLGENETENSSITPEENRGSGDFTIRNGQISLGGQLTLPSTEGPYPAVVAVHGSGRATRKRDSYPALLKAGIAVLRYDKRGCGESTGTYENVGSGNSVRVFNDLASDALAWVDFLRNHQEIDAEKIGLIGVSQAGWIIPLAASQSENVAFAVNISGPSVTVGQEIFYSNLTGEGQFNADRTINGLTIEQLTGRTKKFSGQHGFDPVDAISNLNIPAIWVLGELDESIPTALTVEILKEIKTRHSKNFTIQVKPNGNHSRTNVITGEKIPVFTADGGINDWILDVINAE